MMRSALLVLLLFFAGCGGPGPGETFTEAMRAREAKDWKAFYATFHTDSSDMVLYYHTAAAGYLAGEDEKVQKELGELLERYGADTGKLEQGEVEWEKMARALRRAFADVNDREGLFIDLVKFSERNARPGKPFNILGVRVQDVEVEGDMAKAAMALRDGSSRELKFLRDEEEWKIDVRP